MLKLLRCLGLAVALAAVSAPVARGAVNAYVYTNVSSFKSSCGTYQSPSYRYNQAMANYRTLGYTTTGYYGGPFTRTTFINNLKTAFAIYVSSHGDNYWDTISPYVNSAFLQNPASGCGSSADRVYSIYGRAKRNPNIEGSAVPPYYLVIISTCRLGLDGYAHYGSRTWSGYVGNTMPHAFRFAYSDSAFHYTKTSTTAQWYLGYRNYTWDTSAYAFERNFFAESVAVSHTLTTGYNLALSEGPYESVPASAAEDGVYNPFAPSWYGNPSFRGQANGY